MISTAILGSSGDSSTATFVALTTILVCPATKSRVSSLVLLVWFCLLLGVLYLKDTVCVKSEIPTEENVIDGIFLSPAIGVCSKSISPSDNKNPLCPHVVLYCIILSEETKLSIFTSIGVSTIGSSFGSSFIITFVKSNGRLANWDLLIVSVILFIWFKRGTSLPFFSNLNS